MKAVITGRILEKCQKVNKTGEIIECVRMYQEGLKAVLEIKNVNYQGKIGDMQTIEVEVFPWAFNGKTGLSIKAI